MAQSKSHYGSLSWSQDKSQPRHLPRSVLSHPCAWMGCSARATVWHTGQVYCASHLFKILQQQWQE
jgi:hypothetical protein